MMGMSGFQVVVEELRSAATAAEAAATAATGIDLASPLEVAGAALPGSASSTRAPDVAGAWRDEVGSWVDDVRKHATRLAAMADKYAAVDENTAANLRGIGAARPAD